MGQPDLSARLVSFIGSDTGSWRVSSINAVIGETLPASARMKIVTDVEPSPSAWALRGIRSNERYTHRAEKNQLLAKQEGLGRAEATCAALIPIRKTAAWWLLTQDERRNIFEEQSKHVTVGIEYLPEIARRLYHCRDLSEHEPFDFLTWFEFAPAHEPFFNEMLFKMRASEEWKYVEREVDIRLVQSGS